MGEPPYTPAVNTILSNPSPASVNVEAVAHVHAAPAALHSAPAACIHTVRQLEGNNPKHNHADSTARPPSATTYEHPTHDGAGAGGNAEHTRGTWLGRVRVGSDR